MPKVKNCPVCNTRMLRLYERESSYGARSKIYGYLWFCPYNHIAIVDHRKSDAPIPFELKEIVQDAST